MYLDIRYTEDLIKDDFAMNYKINGEQEYYKTVKDLLKNLSKENCINIIAYTVIFDRLVQEEVEFNGNKQFLKIYLCEEYKDGDTYTYLLDKNNENDMRKLNRICKFFN